MDGKRDERRGWLEQWSNRDRDERKCSGSQTLSPEYAFHQMKEMSVLKVIFCDVNQKAPLALGHAVTEGSREVIQ